MTGLIAEETLVRICAISDLEVERGRAALLGSEQLALFLLADGTVHAVSNLDPYSGANVISRGIVGTRGEAPTVASPLHKQVFDLRTGACLETQGKPDASLRVYPVRVTADGVHVDVAGAAAGEDGA
ncbi:MULTISPECIES: nitrite reductase small subunit NirD [unclassified Microbacterium]|uniref:nitrite reductase small subunit NirD n=1 Tax=unclassified Microbacterium TaxID=2609290 RepID=UPI000D517585|nr:nitrite reductase small subunit NirD [Microbacterium sp. TPD7012]PVE95627.1 nitrite reductase (NAD(P)H) small subunit [Microbacterium sp. TPD7012]